MIQLIITIVAIALTAALLAASVNYLPWWQKYASDTESVVRTSAPLLEQAYDVVVRQANGVAPSVGAGADGGLMSNFGSVLKLPPAAPQGFTWKYGVKSGGSAPWAGLNYFCLEYTDEAEGAPVGAWQGLRRAAAVFSPQQYVLGNSCGDTTSVGTPSEYPAPLALTLYVAYTPGITR